jgi:outer membrane protein assembly factor BamB
VALSCAAARADNWPQWRGPDNNGISNEKGLPAAWGEKQNVVWKLRLSGQGMSTPAIWGDRIFLTSAEGNNLMLVCVSTAGKQLWKRKLGTGERGVIKRDEATEASASPSTDGKHVFAYVGSGDCACFDFEGNEVWKFSAQSRYGRFSIYHGMHSTPLLHKDRLYLSLLHSNGWWVIAVDKATGKDVWKVPRKSDAVSESKEAYTSPCLWRDGKEDYLVVHGADYTTAHRLSDGGEVWRLGGLNPKTKYQKAFRIISSPVSTPDLLVVPTCRGDQVVAVKAGADGLVKGGKPAEQWRKAKGSPDVPSPLVHDGLVYLGRENGVLICLDAKTGKQHYEQSLTRDRYRASPVYVDGKIILTARGGTFTVIKAGPKFELLETNRLNEEFAASPVVSGGRIYLRGFSTLYAIAEGGK